VPTSTGTQSHSNDNKSHSHDKLQDVSPGFASNNTISDKRGVLSDQDYTPPTLHASSSSSRGHNKRNKTNMKAQGRKAQQAQSSAPGSSPVVAERNTPADTVEGKIGATACLTRQV